MHRDVNTEAAGDYVGGQFLPPEGELLTSHDPARGAQIVFTTAESVERVDLAVEHAREAQAAWAGLGLAGRWKALTAFRAAIERRAEPIAEAIVREMGKIRSEARLEVASLVARFDLSRDRVLHDLKDGALPGFPGEALRWQPHGVVGVIGPFNFPVHLSHAHIVPALLLGNTVVLKPSEITPLSAVRYLEAAHEAGLPAGVLNLVQGRAASGMALVRHRDVKAIAFTGSWPVGRKILEATLDKPETLLALEMGGKNVSVVCEDADLRQAAHEIVIGGYLTTGQRCTCTDRVLVHKSRAKGLVDALARLVSHLTFGDPDEPSSFAGPMATEAGLAKLERALEIARSRGADAIVPGERKAGGSFRTGSVHLLPPGVHDLPGYTDVELFGPDLGVETFDGDDEAIAVVAGSPYGFACSVFTADDARFERYRSRIRLGLLNHNRSTNQASPRLPFGGTGRSGNFRPAGAFAARNLAVPVAVQSNVPFVVATSPHLREQLPPVDLDLMEKRHALEESNEAAQEPERALAVRIPDGAQFAATQAVLERLSAGGRFLHPRPPLVVEHGRCGRGHVGTVDDPPLSLLDGASPSMPLGPAEGGLVRAYLDGRFGGAAIGEEAEGAAEAYAAALRAKVPGLPEVRFTDGPSEANELALASAIALSSERGVLVFSGSRHGATQALKRLSGQPALATSLVTSTVPWPATDGDEGAAPTPALIAAARRGDEAALEALEPGADPALAAELRSLRAVAAACASGEIGVALVEPVPRGTLRPASARFHQALFLLLRAHGVLIVMDETEVGFQGPGLAWHDRFDLRDEDGAPARPDFVTFGAAAQVGVVMGARGLEGGEGELGAALVRGRLIAERLSHLGAQHEALLRPLAESVLRRWPWVSRSRVVGRGLALELPAASDRDAYVAQERYRGALVDTWGERGVRYRLPATLEERDVAALERALHRSLAWIEAMPGRRPAAWEELAGAEAPLPVTVEPVRVPELAARIEELAGTIGAERMAFASRPDALAALASRGGTVVGLAAAVPVEAGRDDRPDALEAIVLAADDDACALALFRELVRVARAARAETGEPRWRWLTTVDDRGACARLGGVKDASGPRWWLPLRGPTPSARAAVGATIRLDGPPFASAPPSLADAERAGLLAGATVSALPLGRLITPALGRAIEWLGMLAPELPHLSFTAGASALVDRAIELTLARRPSATTVLRLDGTWAGDATLAARAVSGEGGWLDVVTLPHPAIAGVEAALEAIRFQIARRKESVAGIVFEPVSARTGLVTSDDFLAGLAALQAGGLPVVALESASAYHRSGRGAFFTSAGPLTPDVLGWRAGPRLGVLHTRLGPLKHDHEGDELTAILAHHWSRAARGVDVVGTGAELVAILRSRLPGVEVRGAGLHLVLSAGGQAEAIVARLAALQLKVEARDEHVVLRPPLDRADEVLHRIVHAEPG